VLVHYLSCQAVERILRILILALVICLKALALALKVPALALKVPALALKVPALALRFEASAEKNDVMLIFKMAYQPSWIVMVVDGGKTRMIGLSYGEKNYDNMLCRFHRRFRPRPWP